MSGENPAREARMAYTWLFAIFIGLAVAYFTLPLEVVAFFLAPAIPGAIVAFMVGMIQSEQARKRSRMERGEGVIAKWTLNAAQWQEFERLNKGVITTPHIAAKRLEPPAPGVEVIFTEDAVYVDGDHYTMDRAWATNAVLSPSSIELAQGGLETHQPVCVPIPAGHYGDAERVASHFNAYVGKVW